MLITPFARYGLWIDKANGYFLELQYFESTVCHGSGCAICGGKKYLRKNGTIGGGKMYVFEVVNSFDARRVICPKCANEHLWKIKPNMNIGLVGNHGMR